MAFRTNKTPVLQTKSASGAVATFNTALAMPLVNGEFTIEAYQEGSGDPSPVNVRNIVPFNKLRIGMVDWNCLYDFTENSERWKVNGSVTRTWSDGALTISNGNTNSAYVYQEFQEISGHKMLYYCVGKSIKDESATLYSALSIYAGTGTTNITKYFTNEKATYSGIYEAISTATNRLQFRPNNVSNSMNVYELILVDLTQMFGEKIANYLYSLETQQAGAGVAVFRQLFYKDYYDYNVGETWVSVASVNGDSYPDYAEVNLGEDVYGGSYNIDGTKKKNASIATFNNTNGWSEYSTYFRTSLIDGMDTTVSGYNGLCNIIPVINYIGNGIMIGSNARRAFIGRQWLTEHNINSLADMDNLLASTPLTITFPLAEPTETDIGATPISTNIGNNTIFADTGDIDLTYKDLDIAKRGNFREVFKLPS